MERMESTLGEAYSERRVRSAPHGCHRTAPAKERRRRGRRRLAADLHPAGVECGRARHPQQLLSGLLVGSHGPHHRRAVASESDRRPGRRIHGAIATWSEVLTDCFDGLITLTTSPVRSQRPARCRHRRALRPDAGGVVFGGYAICGEHRCPNILVRSDLPPSLDRDPYALSTSAGWRSTRSATRWGSATRRTCWRAPTSWARLAGFGDPVLSDCDIDALAFVFAWALAGTDPTSAWAAGPYDCSLD